MIKKEKNKQIEAKEMGRSNGKRDAIELKVFIMLSVYEAYLT